MRNSPLPTSPALRSSSRACSLLVTAWLLILPLPTGEGRGEGEQGAPSSPVNLLAPPSVSSLVVSPVPGGCHGRRPDSRAETLLLPAPLCTPSRARPLLRARSSSATARSLLSARLFPPPAATVDLAGQHLYPGIIALNTVLGLTEISASLSTATTEVGDDFTPDVESWIAVNPDSELIPVTRANGITCLSPCPRATLSPASPLCSPSPAGPPRK